MLEKIIDIQKVGRFEKLKVPSSLRFSKITLIFGENGWGKSTIADILRSFGRSQPEIIRGRETLATGGAQKVILLFMGSKKATFEGSTWAGGMPPPITVFDQTFINENVYSGEIVSHDHLKRQYGLVVGEEGVAILRAIQGTEKAEKETRDELKDQERFIQTLTAGIGLQRMSASDFAALERLEDAETVIESKEIKLKRATERKQIQNAILPELLPIPTSSGDLKFTLARSVEGVSAEARERLQAHIAAHPKVEGDPTVSQETWLEAGLAFSTEEACPFCGQELRDRSLIDLYDSYFSAAFKSLAEDVKKRRQTFARYEGGDFRKAVGTTIRANTAAIENLTNLTKEVFLGRMESEALIVKLEEVARSLDGAFQAKQEDLVSVLDPTPYADAFRAWDTARESIETYNRAVQDYRDKIEAIRRAQEGANIETLTQALAILKARVKRHEADTQATVTTYTELLATQARLKKQKEKQRGELKDYSARVTARLGSTINAYLKRLGAGFTIKYDPPNFKGQEPAAAYALMINETPVSPRADDVATPSFRNTLSTGDKSVLALALFLATVDADPRLAEMIVVLDDPFTSMDDFRRRFTANEINKLTTKAAQVIVLSHEKGFLRLLWERIDRSQMTTCAIQTGAPGMASLAVFDVEQATRPREDSERDKVLQFLDVTEGDPEHIRPLLRTVLENFYRKGDPDLFAPNELLAGIIDKLKKAAPDYRYKAAVDDLEDINFYTRESHHAPISGSVTEATSVEELKTYCERVRDLTRGSV
ncbi:AAA family ATPase [Roseicitreum antarcticum]|uniref:Wobble nucleotide-excising tRNase n=1 Tax=Roseicitreum antarcticum TaxID=564137 RepID=A0A1H3F1X9_9RHOB|nr:AAA family ATPase [Roseicitreum antarcticum]SDX84328.1 Wobble nucleotide-excising tRNase [Roseicitreum antarcticum]